MCPSKKEIYWKLRTVLLPLSLVALCPVMQPVDGCRRIGCRLRGGRGGARARVWSPRLPACRPTELSEGRPVRRLGQGARRRRQSATSHHPPHHTMKTLLALLIVSAVASAELFVRKNDPQDKCESASNQEWSMLLNGFEKSALLLGSLFDLKVHAALVLMVWPFHHWWRLFGSVAPLDSCRHSSYGSDRSRGATRSKLHNDSLATISPKRATGSVLFKAVIPEWEQ